VIGSLAFVAVLLSVPAVPPSVPGVPSSKEGQTQDLVGSEEVALAIRTGVEYLAQTQNADGSWGGVKDATFTSAFGNPATYKCWQIGASGLATRAMLELGETREHAEAVDRGLDFLIANANPVRPAEWDVDNNWALIYALDSVAKALQHPRYAEGHEKTPALREAGQKLLAGLKKYQSPRGGWGYYSSRGAGWRPEWATSFTTAAAVLAIIEAREAGLTIDEKVYTTGVRAVKRTRLPNKAYDYGVSAIPRHMRLESINQVKGSLGRIQVCNLALFRAGEAITEDDLVWGLIQFVKHHKFLDVARNKPIPHEAYYANAAYFYLFAHYYAAQVLEVLPAAKREQFGPHIQAGVLKARQKDGSMWDFWIASNTKAYGTAFGTMGLERTTQPTE
jgi:hypothetical protein